MVTVVESRFDGSIRDASYEGRYSVVYGHSAFSLDPKDVALTACMPGAEERGAKQLLITFND
jgi:hypothetical protein